MVDLKIDLLRLRVENGAGQEHRIGPITARAAAIFTERVAGWRGIGLPAAPVGADAIVAAPVRVNLARMSDAEAASEIAGAWLVAVTTMAGNGRTAGPERTRRP